MTTNESLTITRIFNAPRELVYQMWTDPKHLAVWWGPKYFTNPVVEVDPRPGGIFYAQMTDPDGVAYPAKGTFREVVPNERLVFTTSSFEDESGVPQLEGLNTVTFEEYEGKTKLTLQTTILRSTPEVAWALSQMNEGWTGSFEKLDEALVNLSASR